MQVLRAKIADCQKGEVVSVEYINFVSEDAMQGYVNAIPGDTLVILKYEMVEWNESA